MKSIMNRIAILAAGAVVLGTTAFGQTMVMKAQIPFAFHSGHATLPAGDYVLTTDPHNATEVTMLRSAAANRGVYAVGTPADPWLGGKPALLFRCGNQGCRLSGMRTSAGTVTYYAPRKAPAGEEEVAVIAVLVRSPYGD